MVSNQRDVVLTDAQGRYQLPALDAEMIVFITKPPEYELPLDENNLPQFYYIHHPAGSPRLKYQGIAPTGPLPDSVDFALLPGTTPTSEIQVIAFCDPQPHTHQELDWYRDTILPELAGEESDLVIVLGDLVFDDLNLYPRYIEIMGVLDRPIFNVIGNHDLNADADGNRFARETFRRHFGPNYYSFEYGDIHFIALDNVDHLGGGAVRGRLDARQLEWLQNNLAHVEPRKLVVLLAHIPLHVPVDSNPRLNTTNRGELFSILADWPNVLYLSGHLHAMAETFIANEAGRHPRDAIHQIITATGSGAWWHGPKDELGIPIALHRDGSPQGYHVLTFNGTEYENRYVPTRRPRHFQMRIEAPIGQIRRRDTAGTDVVVNVFNASEQSRVELSINGSSWTRMQPAFDHSPAFVRMRRENTGRIPEWIQPIRTLLWRESLPELPVGIHQLTVRTESDYGQAYVQNHVLEVIE